LRTSRKFRKKFWKKLKSEIRQKKLKIKVETDRKIYGQYSLSDLLNHRAIIIFPYIKSTMYMFEVYSMNIPILVPSLNYLTKLEMEYQNAVNERIYWDNVPDTDESAKFFKYSPTDDNINAFVNINFYHLEILDALC
jgi:hypothetical protein